MHQMPPFGLFPNPFRLWHPSQPRSRLDRSLPARFLTFPSQWRSPGHAARMSQYVFKIFPHRPVMIALSPAAQRRALSGAASTALKFYTNRQLELYAARKANKLSLRQLVGRAFGPLVLVLISYFLRCSSAER